jgi:hypothetical protein
MTSMRFSSFRLWFPSIESESLNLNIFSVPGLNHHEEESADRLFGYGLYQSAPLTLASAI